MTDKITTADSGQERLGCGLLSDELEAELIDALGGDEVGDELARHFEECGECASLTAELSAIATELSEDRKAVDPGGAFFEALHADIMKDVRGPADSREQVVAGGPVVESTAPSLLDTLRNLFSARPTLAYGALMAVILVAVIAASLLAPSNLRQEDDRPAPMAARVADEPVDPEVLRLAAEIEIDLDGSDWDDDDEGDEELFGSGFVPIDALSDDEFETFNDELERLL